MRLFLHFYLETYCQLIICSEIARILSLACNPHENGTETGSGVDKEETEVLVQKISKDSIHNFAYSFEDFSSSKYHEEKEHEDSKRDWAKNLKSLSDDKQQESGNKSPSFLDDEFDDPVVQLAEYTHWIFRSDAYDWLLCKLRQHFGLYCEGRNLISEIGSAVGKQLQKEPLVRGISRQKFLPIITMTFKLAWNPLKAFIDHGVDPKQQDILKSTLTLTGTVRNAQSMTVTEYMAQTWPKTWEPIIILIGDLISLPLGEEALCKRISTTQVKEIGLTTRSR